MVHDGASLLWQVGCNCRRGALGGGPKGPRGSDAAIVKEAGQFLLGCGAMMLLHWWLAVALQWTWLWRSSGLLCTVHIV